MNTCARFTVCASMIIGPASGFTPRPYQQAAIMGGDPRLGIGIMPAFGRYRRVLAVMATGCHRRGQLVLRANGEPVAVENVQVGDLLLGPDGAPRRVLRLNRGAAPMYEVRPVKGEPFVVDGDHVLVLDRTPTGRPSFQPGSVEVTVSEWLTWNAYQRHLHKLVRATAVEFSREPVGLLIPPYILGVMIGDGALKQGVRVSSMDIEVHDALRSFAKGVGLSTRMDHYPGRCIDVRLVGTGGPKCNRVLDELGSLGLRVGSGEKFIPDDYKYASIEQRRELLAGLIDTDGGLADCNFDYVTGSARLAADVAFVARSLGLAAYMSGGMKYAQNGSGGYFHRICISGDTHLIPVKIPRKRAPVRRQKKSVLRTGFSIEPTSTTERFYGFTLDGDHRYLLGDFTITHNCGKTEVYLAVVRRFLESAKIDPSARALILAHRDELVSQPIERAPRFGLGIAREQGKETGVGRMERVVASTIQSMNYRLKLYRENEFGLIVIDEAHHAAATDYQELLDRYPNAYVLGMTATPARLDGIALGEVFEASAVSYPIEKATPDGWLVPTKVSEEPIEGLDLTKLRTRAGDLPPGPLGELMAEYAHPVARNIVAKSQGRDTIVFCATVAHAHAQAAALRRYTGERVEVADGGTDKGLRRDIVAAFRRGEVRYLVNAMLWTEGFDAPNASCVAIVRPTQSRSLLLQAIGRGTRPLPGTVDRPELRESAEDRRAAIAASAKPDLLVLDFVAQVERVGLASPVDALAGSLTAEERLALGKIELVGDKTIDEVVREAQRLAAVAAAEAAALSEAESQSRELDDPWDPCLVMSMKLPRDDPREPRCSTKMAQALGRFGIDKPENISASRAKKLMGCLVQRATRELCTFPQQLALQKAGVPASTTSRMYFKTASDLMTELGKNGWRRPARWETDPRLGGRAKAS